ncbi:unnamed protein product [Cuscuta campestris]|uniref:Uncharacterized protein n=1 Tax=Cuscuta campestris TaxID=132261 RepID=A0A484MQ17_9ASTE|nr:unnamed protein product [Cuscuta campestris]
MLVRSFWAGQLISQLNLTFWKLDWARIAGQPSRVTVHLRHLNVEITSVQACLKAYFWGIMGDMGCSLNTLDWISIPIQRDCDLSKIWVLRHFSQR